MTNKATSMKEWRERNREKLRAYARKWRKAHPEADIRYNKKRKAKAVEYNRLVSIRSPQKARAWRIVQKYIRTGRMFSLPCKVCGKSKSQAHHPDYSKPLDVIWLCQLHHSAIHHNLISIDEIRQLKAGDL